MFIPANALLLNPCFMRVSCLSYYLAQGKGSVTVAGMGIFRLYRATHRPPHTPQFCSLSREANPQDQSPGPWALWLLGNWRERGELAYGLAPSSKTAVDGLPLPGRPWLPPGVPTAQPPLLPWPFIPKAHWPSPGRSLARRPIPGAFPQPCAHFWPTAPPTLPNRVPSLSKREVLQCLPGDLPNPRAGRGSPP